MALKSFKRVFDSNKCYLVLTTESGDTKYDTIKIITETNEKEASKLETDKIDQALRNSLKASGTDLIFDLSEVAGCNDRKKGFRFKDFVNAENAGKEVYVNASNTILYGNVEVLGIDIKALYISADKRLVGKGKADSAKIKNESIQSALKFANIDGLKGELGCDINGVENYNFYYLNIENKVNKEDVAEAKTVYEDAKNIYAELSKSETAATADSKAAAIVVKDKALKKYSNMAQAYLRAVEEKKIADKLEDAKKVADEAQKMMDEEKIQKEDNFLESLGIRFKQASVIHYEAQDVDKDLNGVLQELKQKIEGNSGLLA